MAEAHTEQFPDNPRRFYEEANATAYASPRDVARTTVALYPYLPPPYQPIPAEDEVGTAQALARHNYFWDANLILNTDREQLQRSSAAERCAYYELDQLDERLTAIEVGCDLIGLSIALDHQIVAEMGQSEEVRPIITCLAELTDGNQSRTAIMLNSHARHMLVDVGLHVDSVASTFLPNNRDLMNGYISEYDSKRGNANTAGLLPNAELLRYLRRDQNLHYVPADRRTHALRILRAYDQWKRHESSYRTAYVDPARAEAQESPEEIAADTIDLDALIDRSSALQAEYRALSKDFHVPTKHLEKKGYRPLYSGILQQVRNPDGALEMNEIESTGVKRMMGVMYGMRVLGRQGPGTVENTLRTLFLQERVLHREIHELEDRVAGFAMGANVQPSVHEDMDWIARHWSQLAPIVRAHWPKGEGDQAIPDIQQVLDFKRAFDKEMAANPRARLYALARNLGKAALVREVRDSAPSPARATLSDRPVSRT